MFPDSASQSRMLRKYCLDLRVGEGGTGWHRVAAVTLHISLATPVLTEILALVRKYIDVLVVFGVFVGED